MTKSQTLFEDLYQAENFSALHHVLNSVNTVFKHYLKHEIKKEILFSNVIFWKAINLFCVKKGIVNIKLILIAMTGLWQALLEIEKSLMQDILNFILKVIPY